MNHTSAFRRWVGPLSAALSLFAAASVRAADPFDIKDAAEFAKCVDTSSAKLQKLGGDMKFVEGPVWVPQGDGYLVFSDIPANELKKWDAKEGVKTFRTPSDNVNGNAIDPDGRLVHASHSRRQVLRTEKDGTITTLADKFEGKKFNSPNDIVIACDGTIFFTDPPYGLPKGQTSEIGFNGVYRLDPKTKTVKLLDKEVKWPNGIALSHDEKVLYVAVSDPKNPVIRAYALNTDGTVGAGKDLCKLDKGSPDGIRVDADGRIWSSAGDGVHIFSPDGKLIGKILVPEAPANVGFGGKEGNTLFITARKSLYAIEVKVRGAK